MPEHEVSSAVTDTPSSSPGMPSLGSASSRSPLGEITAQLTGTGISVLCALKASALLTCGCDPPVMGPLGAPRWLWALAALVLIAVPTSGYQARKLLQALIGAKVGSGR